MLFFIPVIFSAVLSGQEVVRSTKAAAESPGGCAHLVLAVVLLRVPQHSVTQLKHVLVVRVLLVSQLLQTDQRSLASFPLCEGSLQNAEDLNQTQTRRGSLTSMNKSSLKTLHLGSSWVTRLKKIS